MPQKMQAEVKCESPTTSSDFFNSLKFGIYHVAREHAQDWADLLQQTWCAFTFIEVVVPGSQSDNTKRSHHLANNVPVDVAKTCQSMANQLDSTAF